MIFVTFVLFCSESSCAELISSGMRFVSIKKEEVLFIPGICIKVVGSRSILGTFCGLLTVIWLPR